MAKMFHRAKNWAYDKIFGFSCGAGSSGNVAFDAYREETLRRLEEEQRAFGAFMERLKRARDREEFERFMDERRSAGR